MIVNNEIYGLLSVYVVQLIAYIYGMYNVNIRCPIIKVSKSKEDIYKDICFISTVQILSIILGIFMIIISYYNQECVKFIFY